MTEIKISGFLALRETARIGYTLSKNEFELILAAHLTDQFRLNLTDQKDTKKPPGKPEFFGISRLEMSQDKRDEPGFICGTGDEGYSPGNQRGDVGILVNHGKLCALGKPRPNGVKFFSTVEVITLLADPDWLDEATKNIGQFWKRKHARRNGFAGEESGKAAVRATS